jgi:TonB-linked SusC/RagA family outer membrane protein
MKTLFSTLICIILLTPWNNLSAQDEQYYIIRGTVKDSLTKETLVGVNVYLKDSLKGTITDSKGFFSLKLNEGNYTIVISYVGYRQKELAIKADRDYSLEIFLSQQVTSLEEVKITGQRRFFGNMDYGREIPSLGADIIEKQNINNASDILHARVAGVWATKTSGAPGDHEKIRIRGQNSFFSSAEPLYVVDGVPVPIVNMSSLGIADLNIYDIENITVLKDASSTALYGFQGGNGVVLIDTKKGGKQRINFTTKFGYQWFDNFYDLMTSEEQLAAFDSIYSILGYNYRNTYPLLSDTLCNRDWQKDIFQNGLLTENQVSASGKFKNTSYYFSANYMNQTGILPESKYNRFTFSSKLSRNFFRKLAVEAGYRGSKQGNENNQNIYKGNRLIFEGINRSPCLECTPDSIMREKVNYADTFFYGRYLTRILQDYGQLVNNELPASIISENNHTLSINTNIFNISARLQINDHLSLNGMGSLMFRKSDYDLKYGYFYYSTYGQYMNNILLKSREEVILLNHQYNLSYNRNFNKHEVDFVAAYRYYQDNLWWEVDTLKGSLEKYSYLRNSMAAYGVKGSVRRLMHSFVANMSYNFKRKYFISAVANVSKIKEGYFIEYYSLFPSIALSWDLAREWPFRNIRWLNSCNIYTNWGNSGNYPLNGLANDLYTDYNYTYGEMSVYRPAVEQFANHFLSHESTSEFNAGFDINILNNRLNLKAARYLKEIDNLIVLRDIPLYYGGGKQYINLGTISVTGSELEIDAIPVKRKNFIWHLKFNISSSDQNVITLLEDRPMEFNDLDILIPKFVIEENRQMGNIYGYKCLGKWTQEDKKAKTNKYINRGEMKFLNADSTSRKLDDKDKVVIGNALPEYIWNLSNTFRIYNFSIDLLWYAAIGMEKFNATRAGTFMAVTNKEINNYINDTLSAIRYEEFYQSDLFIDDASFIRLKTITVSYEPSKVFIKNAKINISISFENLITITKYRGYDPEATIFTDNNFSDNAIDKGAVPNPKAMYMSLGITF